MELADDMLAALLCIGMPLLGAWKYRRLELALAAGSRGARIWTFAQTIVTQWLILGALVMLWSHEQRSWSQLGWSLPGTFRFMAGGTICLVLAGLFLLQGWYVRGNPEAQKFLRKSTENLKVIAPSNDAEMRLFLLLSLTAGICEETLYRGYLLWYFTERSGAVWAVLVATVAFGLGHFYQGITGVLKTAKSQ